jgi:hypothetical protein
MSFFLHSTGLDIPGRVLALLAYGELLKTVWPHVCAVEVTDKGFFEVYPLISKFSTRYVPVPPILTV